MKLKGITKRVLVILVVWIALVIHCNSECLQPENGLINSTIGKIVSQENCLLQRLCQPFSVSASIKTGSYDETQVINLKTSLPISHIYYTLDGTEPTEEGIYQNRIKVYGSETLTFVAVNLLTGAKSAIVSETYVLPSMIERMVIDKDTFDPILIREIKTELNKLDSVVIKQLFTQDVRIKLINCFADEPSLLGYSIPEQALALYFNQTIYVLKNRLQFDGMVSTYIHELGHAYDYNFKIDGKMLSEQPEFQTCWQTESLTLLPDIPYFNTSSLETFAQCFALYYYSEGTKQYLKLRAPQTYSYLEKVINFT